MEFGASSCYRLFGLDAKCQQIILVNLFVPCQLQNTRLFLLVAIIYMRHMFFCILLQEELFYVLRLLFPCGAAVEMKLMKQRNRRKGGGAEIWQP